MAKIGLIVPSHEQWDYVHRTVTSFFDNTPGDNRCYVIDDHSDDWNDGALTMKHEWPIRLIVMDGPVHDAPKPLNAAKTLFYHFPNLIYNGLARSWNAGLRLSTNPYWGADYMICGHSDMVFSRGWDEPMLALLERYDFAGPLTNAPGLAAGQNVNHHLHGFINTDDDDNITQTAAMLRGLYRNLSTPIDKLSGFMIMAKTDTWWKYSPDLWNVFSCNEQLTNTSAELQRRITKEGDTMVRVLGSFVWHYKGVSRGRCGTIGIEGSGASRMKV